MGKDGIFVKPRTKPVSRRRRGAPRTATEHLKRLLDRGFQFVREPGGSRADVYYLGYELGQIWVADNTPRVLVQQEYRLMVAKAAQIDRHFARR
jgi:hypothetical protein